MIAKEVTLTDNFNARISIIEENVAMNTNNGPGGTCHNRVLEASLSDGWWDVDTGFRAYAHLGIIRSNLSGVFGDCGFHGREDCYKGDMTSEAFRDAYIGIRRDTGTSLGWAFDNGGGPFVHEVGGLWVQDFVNPLDEPKFGTDGKTMIVHNAIQHKAYVIRGGFYGVYKCLTGSDGSRMGGPEILGAPTDNEDKANIGDTCNILGSGGTSVDAFQRFQRGCMWWRKGDGKVHIHLVSGQVDEASLAECGVVSQNNEPNPGSCDDECVPGERQCSDSNTVMTCGNTDDDHCYEWLYNSCADGLVCQAGSCVADNADEDPIDDNSGGPCVHHDKRCHYDGVSYQVCVMNYEGDVPLGTSWETFGCPVGETCDESSGGAACVALPEYPDADTDDAVPEAETETPDGDNTILCEISGDAVSVTLTGPFIGTGALMEDPTDPARICVGADGMGWPSGTCLAWEGNDSAYPFEIPVPSAESGFNLVLTDSGGSAIGDSWLRLRERDGSPWVTAGDCSVGGDLVVAGEAPDNVTEEGLDADTDTEPYDAADQEDAAPHSIMCESGPDGTEVRLNGPFLDGIALMENPEAPTGITFGADGYGWPHVGQSVTWAGDDASYVILLPSDVSAFNLYIHDSADSSRDSWLRLHDYDGSPWAASGDCVMGDGLVEIVTE